MNRGGPPTSREIAGWLGALCGDLDLSKVREGKYTTRDGLRLDYSNLLLFIFISVSSFSPFILKLHTDLGLNLVEISKRAVVVG